MYIRLSYVKFYREKETIVAADRGKIIVANGAQLTPYENTYYFITMISP